MGSNLPPLNQPYLSVGADIPVPPGAAQEGGGRSEARVALQRADPHPGQHAVPGSVRRPRRLQHDR